MNAFLKLRLSKTFLRKPVSPQPSSGNISSIIFKTALKQPSQEKEPFKAGELNHPNKIDGETVEVLFSSDWGKDLNNEQVKEELKMFTENAVIQEMELKPKKDGESVVVICAPAYWECLPLNIKQVEEEIEMFTEVAMKK